MAQKKVVMATCDRCGTSTDTSRRFLGFTEDSGRRRQVTFDCCEKCRTSVPLSEWESMIPKRKDGPRRKGRLVVSEETVKNAARRRRKVS